MSLELAHETRYGLRIGGEVLPAAAGRTFTVLNPATGEPVAEVAEAGPEDVDRAVRAARAAFDAGPWPRTPAAERAATLWRLAALLRENAEELARVETAQNGMPLSDARADTELVAKYFDYYAGAITKPQGQTIPVAGHLLDYTVREPIGVVAAIVPWNSPIMMAARKVAPALAAGCAVVLKPASYTPLTALLLADLAAEAGLPAGALNVIAGPGGTTGESLVDHPGVDKIGFTGETATGARIMEKAARSVKRVSLELGGKSAGLVFADCDVEEAARLSVGGVFGNCGQRCNARTRILVEDGVYGRFMDRFLDLSRALVPGDPLRPGTRLGPLISRRQLERVEEYVAAGREEGARLLCGGERPSDPELARGNYYLPTVFDQVRPEMRIAREEIFGPVAAVLRFRGEDEGVALANDSVYGLAATVYTNDLRRALRVAGRLRAGNVSINHGTVNPLEAPYGGYKQSGIGRELGLAALDLYTEVKTVCVGA
jgi:betaine-aldehyde dehydrogenase